MSSAMRRSTRLVVRKVARPHVAVVCLLLFGAQPAFASDGVELTFQGRLPTHCLIDTSGAEIFLADITRRASASATLGIDCNANYSVKMLSTSGGLVHATRGDDLSYAPGYRGTLAYAVSLGLDGGAAPMVTSATLRNETTVLTGAPTRGRKTATLTVSAAGQTDYPLIPGRYRDEILISIVPGP